MSDCVVVVVDDNPTDLLIIQRALKNLNNVKYYSSASAALQCDEQICVLISDLFLAFGESPLALVEALKKKNPNMKSMLYTGIDTGQQLRDALLVFDRYRLKRIDDVSTLEKDVRNLL